MQKCGAESFIWSEVLEYLATNKQYPTLVLEHGARMPPWLTPIQSDECDCSPWSNEIFQISTQGQKAITLSSTNMYATPWIATTKLKVFSETSNNDATFYLSQQSPTVGYKIIRSAACFSPLCDISLYYQSIIANNMLMINYDVGNRWISNKNLWKSSEFRAF